MFHWLLTFNYSAGVVNEFITGVGKCTEQHSFPQIVTSIISSRSATGVGKCIVQLSFLQLVTPVVSSLSATGDGECIVEQLFISITHSPELR